MPPLKALPRLGARCILRVGGWYEAVQDAAARERYANDPAHQALVEDLKQRVMRLRQSMQEGQ